MEFGKHFIHICINICSQEICQKWLLFCVRVDICPVCLCLYHIAHFAILKYVFIYQLFTVRN